MNSIDKVLFIPLDSRPCCSSFVQRLADFRGIQLCMPPMEMLGNLECRGNSEQLWDWLKGYDDDIPAILSVDMLLWGGLVGSRRPADVDEEARRNLMSNMRDLCTRRCVYAFNTIMRVAPTQKTVSDTNEAELLVKASKLLCSYFDSIDEMKEGFASNHAQQYLSSQGINISCLVWRDYLKQRQQKHIANMELLKAWSKSLKEAYLLFGYDDCQTKGFNYLETNSFSDAVAASDNIGITTGADELAQLLLARYATSGQTIGVVWDDPSTKEIITRYEDCTLEELLGRQAKVTQTSLCSDPEAGNCQKLLFVWGPKGEVQEESFVQRGGHRRYSLDGYNDFLDKMAEAMERGCRVVLADVAYANGGDSALLMHLLERRLLWRLSGYAAWNTAGNTLGTALSTLLMLGDMDDRISVQANKRFLLERLLDDGVYESVIRPQFVKAVGGSFRILSERETEVMQRRIKDKLWYMLNMCLERVPFSFKVKDISIRLPWRRLFEADIRVDIE